MNQIPRRDFLKLALAGAFALAHQGCARRGTTLERDAQAQHDLCASLRSVLSEAVERKNVPGAVALVQCHGATLFHEAFGFACSTPGLETPMRPDHKFDLASLTKVVATTSAIMTLRDQGRVELDAPLVTFLPALAASDKRNLTLRQCLTHTTGLPPFRTYYKDGLRGKDAYLRAIAAEPLLHPPGSHWEYSDLGFILLGCVVEAMTGESLADYTQQQLFRPLGMTDTAYRPIPAGAERQAPSRQLTAEFAATEWCPWRQQLMVGAVHDENAYALGGVSGHAGLFSTAPDLARFCQMLLNKGEEDGAQILSPDSVALLDRQQALNLSPDQCLGWRRRTMIDSTLGFLASPRSFGHTGFTGTSLWLDPDNQVAVVLLTNAIHPDRNKAHSAPVRQGFHHAVVERLGQLPAGRVKTGLDVLEAEGFARLRGQRVAVVANPTAVNGAGTPLLDLLAQHPEIRVAAIFSPEHGFAGNAPAGQTVGDSAHGAIPVYSLFGERHEPAPEMADRFDVMLYDIQDVGVRFYTYIWTLFHIQQFCARTGKRLIVLDRPNPLGGRIIEGPVLDEVSCASFVGLKPIPTRYGLTCGELATLFNQQHWLEGGRQAELEVVKMERWRRDMPFHQAGLPWIPSSPNIPTWDTVAVYPGTCIFEGTHWCEGRGTDVPFELVGGPGVNARQMAKELNRLKLAGCHFLPVEFTPRAMPAAPEPKHRDQRCGGVFIRVDDHATFRPVQTGLAILLTLRAQAPEHHEWQAAHFDRLLGTGKVREQIDAGATLARITDSWTAGLTAFDAMRQQAMLYA